MKFLNEGSMSDVYYTFQDIANNPDYSDADAIAQIKNVMIHPGDDSEQFVARKLKLMHDTIAKHPSYKNDPMGVYEEMLDMIRTEYHDETYESKEMNPTTQTFSEDDDTNSLEQWKADVRKQYPQQASQIKFKGKGFGDSIVAEIPGKDQAFGEFNMKTGDAWVAPMDEGVSEALDKEGDYHVSVQKGKFLPSDRGGGSDENLNYLHDLMNISGTGGGPMLVTISDPRIATEVAAMYGGKVLKTRYGTYRIVQSKGQNQKTPTPEPELVGMRESGVAEGSLNESDKFTSWYDWKDQAKSSGYTITRKDDKIVALNKQGQVVGHWSDVGHFLSGKAPRPNFKRPVEQGVAEGSHNNIMHAWNSGMGDDELIKKFGQGAFNQLKQKYGHGSIPVPDLVGYKQKEPEDRKVRLHRGLEGPGKVLKSIVQQQGVSEADKHSFVGKIQRHHELKGKVDQTWKDAADAEKRGDKKAANRSFEKHVKYTNLERPGTWTNVKEQGVAEVLTDTAAQRKAERDKQRTTPAKKQRERQHRKGLTQDTLKSYHKKAVKQLTTGETPTNKFDKRERGAMKAFKQAYDQQGVAEGSSSHDVYKDRLASIQSLRYDNPQEYAKQYRALLQDMPEEHKAHATQAQKGSYSPGQRGSGTGSTGRVTEDSAQGTENKQAWDKGHEAGYTGNEKCPCKPGSAEEKAWNAGHKVGRDERSHERHGVKEGNMKSSENNPTGPSFAGGKWKGTDSAAQAKNKYVGEISEGTMPSVKLMRNIAEGLVRVDDLVLNRPVYGKPTDQDRRAVYRMVREFADAGIDYNDAVVELVEYFKHELSELAVAPTIPAVGGKPAIVAPTGTSVGSTTPPTANTAATTPGTVSSTAPGAAPVVAPPVTQQGVDALAQMVKNAGLSPSQISTLMSKAK